MFLFPPEKDRAPPEPEEAATGELEVPQADMLWAPLPQAASESLELAAENPIAERDDTGSRCVDEDSIQSAQSVVLAEEMAVDQQSLPLGESHADEISQFQEVSRWHSGTGVHIMTLTPAGDLEAREYGAPIAQYAKR